METEVSPEDPQYGQNLLTSNLLQQYCFTLAFTARGLSFKLNPLADSGLMLMIGQNSINSTSISIYNTPQDVFVVVAVSLVTQAMLPKSLKRSLNVPPATEGSEYV